MERSLMQLIMFLFVSVKTSFRRSFSGPASRLTHDGKALGT